MAGCEGTDLKFQLSEDRAKRIPESSRPACFSVLSAVEWTEPWRRETATGRYLQLCGRNGDLGLEQSHLLQTETTFGKNSSLREQGPEFLALLHARVMSALAACILLDMREEETVEWRGDPRVKGGLETKAKARTDLGFFYRRAAADITLPIVPSLQKRREAART